MAINMSPTNSEILKILSSEPPAPPDSETHTPLPSITTSKRRRLYRNLPLPPGTGEAGPSIRLLRLRGVNHDNNELKVFPLKECPEFRALSYCWGDLNDTLHMHCNGQCLNITRNLHLALEHFESEYAGQLFWIDAICIDQEVKLELADQVSIMRDIYSQAKEVLVWLGPSTLCKNIQLGFSACKQYAARMRYYIHFLAETGEADHNLIADASIDLAIRSRPFTGPESDALLEVLRQPYWSRVWIIQELCVSKVAQVHMGEQSMPWDDFVLVLLMMERCMSFVVRNLETNLRALMDLRRLYASEDPASRPHLASLLPQFRWSQATNPLDKVYGLLGLAPSDERNLVDIEYTLSPSECYTKVMFALLEHSRDLSLLLNCNAPSFAPKKLNLPSWVPDWSYDASNLPPPRFGLSESNVYHRFDVTRKGIYEGYQASANSECPTPTLQNSPDGAILTLHGMITDQISEVAPTMELHHQLLLIVDHTGLYVPSAPFYWSEFVSKYWTGLLWRGLMKPITILLFPMNCYRKGAALNVLLTWARLAQSPAISEGEDAERFKILFDTLMKGPQSYKFIQDRVKGAYSKNVTQQLTEEFQILQFELGWNFLLKFMTLVGIEYLFPSLYFSVLGLSYEHFRGTFHLTGLIIGLEMMIAAQFSEYITIPLSVSVPLLLYGLYTSALPIFAPVQPKRLDLLFSAVLDYRLAKTESGRLALVPHNAEMEDSIALLQGGKCPFVVRQQESKWSFVGDSYVHGMMNGEEWRDEDSKEME